MDKVVEATSSVSLYVIVDFQKSYIPEEYKFLPDKLCMWIPIKPGKITKWKLFLYG